MKPLIVFYLLTLMFTGCLSPLSVNAQEEKILQYIYLFSQEEQLVAYQMLVKDDPQNPRLQNSLGFCYYRTADYDSAEQHYVKALALDPTYSVAYNNLGVTYLKKDRSDISKHYFEKAIRYDAHNVKAMYNLGVAYFKKGDYFKALRCYLKAKKMDAAYVKERGDNEKAKKEVEEALNKDPENKILKKVSSQLNH